MNPTGETAIIEGFRNGDHAAVAWVVDRYYAPLYNLLLRLGCRRDEAEDVIQETLLKAAKGLRSGYSDRGRFRPWLYRVAINTFRDHAGKASARREIPVEGESLAAQAEGLDDSAADPAEAAIRSEDERMVRAAVEGLSDQQRLCVILRYFHGLSIREIAFVTRCPCGTVKSRLHTALKQLKSSLAGEME